MSVRALLLAVRNQLQAVAPAGLGIAVNSCEVMPDGRPPARAGKWFYAVHQGPRQSTARHSLDERYSYRVTITARVNEPFDRLGTNLLEKAANALDLYADQVRGLLHMSYPVMNAANTIILSDYVAAGGTGTVYGFSEPAMFEGDDELRVVGPDWFKATVQDDTLAPLGVTCTLRFGRARRLESLTSLPLGTLDEFSGMILDDGGGAILGE